uniref:D-glycerate 3-kinase n=1 Tax=Rhizophora mucronata TaxID=61149 RepID=A0A2P2LMP6_RHIMU
MAALNLLSPPPRTSSSIYKNHDCYNYNSNYYYNYNVQFLPCSHHFRIVSSLSRKPISCGFLSSKVYLMPAHFSKSGSGSSWTQENSVHQDSTSSTKQICGPLHSARPTAPAEVASVQDLFNFICSGPLVNKLGLTSDKIAESIDKWLTYGSNLCRLFQFNDLKLTVPQKARFYHYYIPVFIWCENQISKHRSQFKDGEDVPPLVIGFSAPQGCGKTTLVFALDYLFKVTHRKSVTLSIDDFYLTAEGQAKLREENPGNALLEFRGNAGSHDLPFSIETLTALSKLTEEGKNFFLLCLPLHLIFVLT